MYVSRAYLTSATIILKQLRVVKRNLTLLKNDIKYFLIYLGVK